MRAVRPVLVLALVFSVGPAAVAGAASPAPQLSDPVGDWPLASSDIASVTLGTVQDRKGRPTDLSVTMLLAAAPRLEQPATYRVSMTHGDCEELTFRFLWNGDANGVKPEAEIERRSCRDGKSLTAVEATVVGSSIVWRRPLGKGVDRGTVLKDLTAATTPGGRVRYPLGSTRSGTPVGDSTGVGTPYTVGRKV